MPQHRKQLYLSALFLLLLCCLASAEPAWGTWLHNAAEAKRIAYTYNRPIIAVISSTACTHCDYFENLIINSTSAVVTDFAKQNRLVLLYKRGNISSQVYEELMKQVPLRTQITPYFFILKVKDGADLTTDNKYSLNASQVEIIKSTQFDRMAGLTYPSAGGTINGVTISSQSSWNGTQFNSLIASFFPNQFWKKDMVSEIDSSPDTDPDVPTNPDNPENPNTPELDDSNWGNWLENVAEAKRLAYENNRPLIAVISSTACTHCDYFESRIQQSTSTVLTNFARQNRLVLCYKRGNISSRVYEELMKQVPIRTPITPYVFILKVKKGADLTNDNKYALDADQVEIIHSIPYDRLAGLTYPSAGGTINDVHISSQSAWTCEEFVELIKTFFPNTQGLPLTATPEGYEDAIDLGVVYDNETFPSAGNDSQWTRASGVIEMPADGGTHWFKFTGRPGQRYGLFATHGDETAIPATMPTMSFKLECYSTNSEGLHLNPNLLPE